MAPGPSTEVYAPGDCAALLAVARASVECGLRRGNPLEVDPADYAEPVRALRACFVTLRIRGDLRGCTGRLEPEHPLVVDVARNAYRSAFEDPRFEPLRAEELTDVEFHISVLGPREPLLADSEQALLEKLRPGIDGLVLRDGSAMATFLPSVWESLSEPRLFLHELERKAGLPAGHWSPTLKFERYEALQIRESPRVDSPE
jgi:AmmeMemoRadiSam system protein A